MALQCSFVMPLLLPYGFEKVGDGLLYVRTLLRSSASWNTFSPFLSAS